MGYLERAGEVLFRSGDDWRQAFPPAQAHGDYPLLIPLTNARCWCCLGCDSEWTPALVAACFTFAAAGALAAGVCRLQSRSQGLLAGMVLLGTKAFVTLGAAEYADVPLAFFILASVLLLGLDDAAEQSSPGCFCWPASRRLGRMDKERGALVSCRCAGHTMHRRVAAKSRPAGPGPTRPACWRAPRRRWES